MSNDYYTASGPLTRNTKARAESVTALFAGIEAGFDKLPAELVLKQDRVTYAADTGAANVYVVALPHAPAAYVEGLRVSFKASATNTGASTINVSGLGAKAILRVDGSGLEAGDIAAGCVYSIHYTGTEFRLSGLTASAVATQLGNGTLATPALRFQSDTGVGIRRVSSGVASLVADGVDALTWSASAVTVAGALAVNGNTTLGDASGDSVTLNAGTIGRPNNTGTTLIGGGSDTLYSSGARIGLSGSGASSGSKGTLELSAGACGTAAAGDSTILFYANNALAGRITPTGYAKFTATGSHVSATGAGHEFVWNAAARLMMQHSHASNNFGFEVRYTGTPNGTGNEFAYFTDTDGTVIRAAVRSNGGIANYSANNVNLSDEREKEGIAAFDAAADLDAFLAFEVCNFRYKDQTHEDDNLGVIAQRLRDSHPDNERYVDPDAWVKPNGETRMSVYDGDLHYRTMAQLQHAHRLILALTERVAALEAA